MSEQATAEQVQVSAEQPTNEAQVITPAPFSSYAWSETPPETIIEAKAEEPIIEKKKEEVNTQSTTTEIVEPFYKKLGFEKEEDVENEIKALRENKIEEVKFEDEQSKQIYELLREGGDKKKEVRKFLETQEKLETLIVSEVNEDNAADIVKLGMQLKFKDLSQKEIEYKFNKDFGIPKEPIELATESEDEFQERHNEWKDKVSDIKMNLNIEAKLAKPDLEKAKSELKLPEITKQQGQEVNQPNPELLKEIKDKFLNKLESDYSKPDGFNTQVKDELVEIPVSFKIPDEEKLVIKKIMEGEINGDVSYISKRWFGDNGEPNIERIISDIYLLENTDKVLSGIANNSANQRLIEARKQANNTDLKGITNQNTFQPNADGKANISPFKKEAWSETPPMQLT